MSGRIFITGAGVISPIGVGLAGFEKALYAGASGAGPSAQLSSLAGEDSAACEIRDFTPQTWLGNKGIRVLDRTARLLCVAAHLALDDLGAVPATPAELDAEMGLVCGTMFGSLHSIASFDWSGLTDGPSLVNPMDFPNTVISSAAGQAAIRFKMGGVNSTICAAQASGLYAIHYAAEFLRLRRAKMLLAGGAEELSAEAWLGFKKNDWLAASGAAFPFSAESSGMILGEGAAMLALEPEDAAFAKRPLAEVAGFGAAHDAFSTRGFSSDAEGATEAIVWALESAGVQPDEIACVIASANGSRAGDAMEARALDKIFGSRLAGIPICAPKAALGESLGAGGAFGALVAALALRNQCLAPTAGGKRQDGLRLSGEAQPVHGEYALVNAFSCDGNNAALVLRRVSSDLAGSVERDTE